MTKITKEELVILNSEESNLFQEANIGYLECKCKNYSKFDIFIVVDTFDGDFLFKFKNAEIYLPKIRTALSGIIFDKDGNLVFCGWGGLEGDNQKIIFFHDPDYKTEMEIYKLTEEEAKKYYYV